MLGGLNYDIINPSVAMAFFKKYIAIGAGKLPTGISQVLCHIEIKFQRLGYTMFSRVCFRTVPMPTFTPTFQMAPENRK